MRISDWSSDVCSSDFDGQMEAASDAEVALRLQEQGHLPVEARLAREGGGEPAWRALFQAKPFAGERLVQFTQQLATLRGAEIGRASGRGRVCRYVSISVVGVVLTKKKSHTRQ